MYIPSKPPLDCPECGGKMWLRESRFGLFYGCENFPTCRATHGAHPDGEPLGIPADAETKAARIEAHDAFDKLWKASPPRGDATPRKKRRGRSYAWLQHQLGMTTEECHIGRFDKATCARVVALCQSVTWRDVAAWWNKEGNRNAA